MIKEKGEKYDLHFDESNVNQNKNVNHVKNLQDEDFLQNSYDVHNRHHQHHHHHHLHHHDHHQPDERDVDNDWVIKMSHDWSLLF